MICKICNHDNPIGKKVCDNCGCDLPKENISSLYGNTPQQQNAVNSAQFTSSMGIKRLSSMSVPITKIAIKVFLILTLACFMLEFTTITYDGGIFKYADSFTGLDLINIDDLKLDTTNGLGLKGKANIYIIVSLICIMFGLILSTLRRNKLSAIVCGIGSFCVLLYAIRFDKHYTITTTFGTKVNDYLKIDQKLGYYLCLIFLILSTIGSIYVYCTDGDG